MNPALAQRASLTTRRVALALVACVLLQCPVGVTAQTADLKAVRQAAEGGNPYQQFNLGLAYDKGTGVEQNHAAAVEWYRKAAEQGLAVAQYNLGVKYEKGDGVARDPAAAVQWYRKAAEQGNARAQVNLGVKYATGNGVPEDMVLAHLWFRLAAVQGDANAAGNVTRAEQQMTPGQIEAAKTLFDAWAPRLKTGEKGAR